MPYRTLSASFLLLALLTPAGAQAPKPKGKTYTQILSTFRLSVSKAERRFRNDRRSMSLSISQANATLGFELRGAADESKTAWAIFTEGHRQLVSVKSLFKETPYARSAYTNAISRVFSQRIRKAKDALKPEPATAVLGQYIRALKLVRSGFTTEPDQSRLASRDASFADQFWQLKSRNMTFASGSSQLRFQQNMKRADSSFPLTGSPDKVRQNNPHNQRIKRAAQLIFQRQNAYQRKQQK